MSGVRIAVCDTKRPWSIVSSSNGALRLSHCTWHSDAGSGQKYLERLTLEDGKDIDTKRMRLHKNIIPYFASTPLDGIDISTIERYKAKRKSDGAKAGTINRELAVVSHIFGKAMEWGWIDRKPMIRKYREEGARLTYLTIDQLNHLKDVAEKDRSPQVYLFIRIALDTSMRRREILSIQIANIDLERRLIYIPRAKGGRREQPITAAIVTLLRPYVEAGGMWLFPSTGKRKSDTGHTKWIEAAFRRVVEAAGMDPHEVLRHTLRHTAVTHLVQAGVDLPTVMRISGHKTLAMVQRYSHQNGEHIEAAMDKLTNRYTR